MICVCLMYICTSHITQVQFCIYFCDLCVCVCTPNSHINILLYKGIVGGALGLINEINLMNGLRSPRQCATVKPSFFREAGCHSHGSTVTFHLDAPASETVGNWFLLFMNYLMYGTGWKSTSRQRKQLYNFSLFRT